MSHDMERSKGTSKINYFSFVGWMKYMASIEGRGCLRLNMSSTTAEKGQLKAIMLCQNKEPYPTTKFYKNTSFSRETPSCVMSAILQAYDIILTVTLSMIST